jgi:hypothetical protein
MLTLPRYHPGSRHERTSTSVSRTVKILVTIHAPRLRLAATAFLLAVLLSDRNSGRIFGLLICPGSHYFRGRWQWSQTYSFPSKLLMLQITKKLCHKMSWRSTLSCIYCYKNIWCILLLSVAVSELYKMLIFEPSHIIDPIGSIVQSSPMSSIKSFTKSSTFNSVSS